MVVASTVAKNEENDTLAPKVEALRSVKPALRSHQYLTRPLAGYLRRAHKRMGQPDHSDHPERSSSSRPTLHPRAAFVGLLLSLALVLGCFFGTALLGIRGSARLFTGGGSAPAPPTPPGPLQPGQAQRRLVVTFFDIGQGDSALVQTPGGKNVLVDTGPPGGRAELFAGLRRAGVNRLDMLVTSHPHQDHFGNSVEVLRRIRTAAAVDTGRWPIAARARKLTT